MCSVSQALVRPSTLNLSLRPAMWQGCKALSLWYKLRASSRLQSIGCKIESFVFGSSGFRVEGPWGVERFPLHIGVRLLFGVNPRKQNKRKTAVGCSAFGSLETMLWVLLLRPRDKDFRFMRKGYGFRTYRLQGTFCSANPLRGTRCSWFDRSEHLTCASVFVSNRCHLCHV